VDNTFDNQVLVSYLTQFFNSEIINEQSRGSKKLGPLSVPTSTQFRVSNHVFDTTLTLCSNKHLIQGLYSCLYTTLCSNKHTQFRVCIHVLIPLSVQTSTQFRIHVFDASLCSNKHSIQGLYSCLYILGLHGAICIILLTYLLTYFIPLSVPTSTHFRVCIHAFDATLYSNKH